jgi:hypothetical protein
MIVSLAVISNAAFALDFQHWERNKHHLTTLAYIDIDVELSGVNEMSCNHGEYGIEN